jgi:hypothetical protein
MKLKLAYELNIPIISTILLDNTTIIYACRMTYGVIGIPETEEINTRLMIK